MSRLLREPRRMSEQSPTIKEAMPLRPNLLECGHQDIVALVSELGWPKYRVQQILSWLYQHRAQDIQQMTNLSKANREQLQAQGLPFSVQPVASQRKQVTEPKNM